MTCTLRCFFLSAAALLVACDRPVMADFVFSGKLELPSLAESGAGQSSLGIASGPTDAITELAHSSSPVAESLSIQGLASKSTSLATTKSSTQSQKASKKTKTKAKAPTTAKPKKSKPAKQANDKKKKNKPGSGGPNTPPSPLPDDVPGITDPLPPDDGSILPPGPGGPFDVDVPPLNSPPILLPELVDNPNPGAPEDEFPPDLSSPPTHNPEPSTMLLLAVGGVCGAGWRVARARRAGAAARA